MRVHSDSLLPYLENKETDISNTDELSEDIIVDDDGGGKVVGIEILGVSDKADLNELVIQSFDKVVVESVKAV